MCCRIVERICLSIVLCLLMVSVGSTQEVIVDNTDSGFTVLSGSWLTGTYSGYWGTNYHYAFTTTIAATAKSEFRPTLPASTTYDVYTWYVNGTNRAADASYTINYQGGATTLRIDQQVTGKQWVKLGTFPFSSGSTGSIQLDNNSSLNTKVIMADAVRFVVSVSTTTTGGGEPPISMDTTPEVRGFWIESWNSGMLSASQCSTLVNDARKYNFNTIIPEIRKISDAYYKSPLEPWADNITPPQFDILSTLLALCHDTSNGKQYIGVHGWMVTMRGWKVDGSVYGRTDYPTSQMSTWFTRTNTGSMIVENTYVYDPGHPEAINYLVSVYTSAVSNYPTMDGVSYDYFRHLASNAGYNTVATTWFAEEYGYAAPSTNDDDNWNQWRRDRVTDLARKLYAEMKACNPKVVTSGALITWSPGPNPGFESTRPYYSVYQDWHTWMKKGYLDACLPMNYFREAIATQYIDYRRWSDFAVNSSYNRHAWIGPGVYLNSVTSTMSQLSYSRYSSKAKGLVLYDYQATNSDGVSNDVFFSALTISFFQKKANVPAMPWTTSTSTGILKGHISCSPEIAGPKPYFNGLKSPGKIYKATVELINQNNGLTYTCKSDITGYYAFIDLPVGIYTMNVRHPLTNAIIMSETWVMTKPITEGVQTKDLNAGTAVPVEVWSFEAE